MSDDAPNSDLSQSAFARGWRDTKGAMHSWWFWVVEAVGGAAMGALNGWLGLIWVIGFFAAVYIWATLAAPIRQRNEARLLKSDEFSLPITITAISAPAYRRFSGLMSDASLTKNGMTVGAKVDTPQLTTEPIFISNTSQNRSVVLLVHLSITDKFGKSHRLHGNGQDAFGKTLGRNDVGTKSEAKHDMPPSLRILSPVEIRPQSTVQGRLAFLLPFYLPVHGEIDEFEMKLLNYYLEGSTFGTGDAHFRYALELEDVASGTKITMPIPSDGYKGT